MLFSFHANAFAAETEEHFGFNYFFSHDMKLKMTSVDSATATDEAYFSVLPEYLHGKMVSFGLMNVLGDKGRWGLFEVSMMYNYFEAKEDIKKYIGPNNEVYVDIVKIETQGAIIKMSVALVYFGYIFSIQQLDGELVFFTETSSTKTERRIPIEKFLISMGLANIVGLIDGLYVGVEIPYILTAVTNKNRDYVDAFGSSVGLTVKVIFD